MSQTNEKIKLLFLCTGNACRSQMAQGWARALKAESIDAWSAGTDPHTLDPRAVTVMGEAGVDISRHWAKSVEALKETDFDAVVTVCDKAREQCPVWFGSARVLHSGFEDPPRLAALAENDNEALDHYRRIRDQIRDYVECLPDSLQLMRD